MEKLEYITQKALIKCSDGGAPGFFTPSYNTTVKINSCVVSTAMDKIPMSNIPTFIVCAKTQKPCMPVATMWQDTYPVKVKGQQTLLGKSCMQCGIGGKIEFLTSGQIPLSAEEEAEINGMRNDVQKAYDEEQKEANKPWWQKAGEFALDMVPIVGPVVSMAKNVSEGNWGMVALDAGFLALDVVGLVATPFTGGASLAASTAAKAGLRARVKGAAKAVAKKMSKEAIKAGAKQTGEMLAKLSVKNLTRGKLCVFACFPAGTPVAVKDGYRNIEEIQVGDEVWAWDEASGELGLKPVIDLMQKESDHTITIFTENEIIETTAEHPFWVNGAWKNAADLITGDKISAKNKNAVEIKKTQFNYDSKKVFNFEVGDWHTYFVGLLEILVHNATRCLSEVVSYGKNMLEKFKKHAQQMREAARKHGIDIPKGATKPETQKVMKEFIDKVVKEGEERVGEYMTLGDCVWHKLDDAIVVRKMSGEFVTFLDKNLGGVANQWDKIL